MNDDKKILDEILHQFVASGRANTNVQRAQAQSVFHFPDAFITVPLALILPAGTPLAVAFDEQSRVIGIKIGRNADAALFSRISRLKKLRRLVVYSDIPVNVPAELSLLEDLDFIWLGGAIKSLPPEIFRRDLRLKASEEASGQAFSAFMPEVAKQVMPALNGFSSPPTPRSRKNTSKSKKQARSSRLVEEYSPPEVFVTNTILQPQVRDAILAHTGLFLALKELESPPLEIAVKGRDAVLRYFDGLTGTDFPLNEQKIILVGNGGAGKTSLVKRIVGDTFNPDESQTHGISIRDWSLRTNLDTEVKLHFWDFGGQEIMHATHQFFLSKRSIYLLVLDGRKDEDPEYWLQHIESFGGDSPTFVVLNKNDENPSYDVNRRFLKNKYNGVVDFFKVSCSNDEGISVLIQGIAEALEKVPMLQTRWPHDWFLVKQELEQLTDPFITLNHFERICIKHNVLDEDSQTILVDFLHDLGIILHFKDIQLLDTHVLDPRWVTEGVYRIINSNILAQQKGFLALAQVATALAPVTDKCKEYSPDKHQYLIDLMLKFELCYRINDSAILVPDLLDIQEPVFDFDRAEALQFSFQYAYLPKSVMPRLIVRMHEDICESIRWRTGVLLEDKSFRSKALVVADDKRSRIDVWVIGKQKRDYFAVIRKLITDINSSFERLQVQELVPLPDAPGNYVDYRELIGHETNGREEYFSGTLGKTFKVKKLLDGIESASSRAQVAVTINGDYYANSAVNNNIMKRIHSEGDSMERPSASQEPANWEKVIVYGSAILILLLLGFLLIRNEPFSDPNFAVIARVVLSLTVAVFGGTVPGFLRVDYSGRGLAIRATGALALFIVTYVLTPTIMPSSNTSVGSAVSGPPQ